MYLDSNEETYGVHKLKDLQGKASSDERLRASSRVP